MKHNLTVKRQDSRWLGLWNLILWYQPSQLMECQGCEWVAGKG